MNAMNFGIVEETEGIVRVVTIHKLVRYFNCPRAFCKNEKIIRLSVSLSDGVSLTH